MRIFLDDLRSPPDNTWTVCRNAADFVAALTSGNTIEAISFDHDLGHPRFTGRIAARLAMSYLYTWTPRADICMHVHSANPVGSDNIRNDILDYDRFRLMTDAERESYGLPHSCPSLISPE